MIIVEAAIKNGKLAILSNNLFSEDYQHEEVILRILGTFFVRFLKEAKKVEYNFAQKKFCSFYLLSCETWDLTDKPVDKLLYIFENYLRNIDSLHVRQYFLTDITFELLPEKNSEQTIKDKKFYKSALQDIIYDLKTLKVAIECDLKDALPFCRFTLEDCAAWRIACQAIEQCLINDNAESANPLTEEQITRAAITILNDPNKIEEFKQDHSLSLEATTLSEIETIANKYHQQLSSPATDNKGVTQTPFQRATEIVNSI